MEVRSRFGAMTRSLLTGATPAQLRIVLGRGETCRVAVGSNARLSLRIPANPGVDVDVVYRRGQVFAKQPDMCWDNA